MKKMTKKILAIVSAILCVCSCGAIASSMWVSAENDVFKEEYLKGEKEVERGQLDREKALIYKASRGQNRGKWYKVSPSPGNAVLTVHKAHYDKHDLHSPAGKGVQLHPASQFPL